MHLTKLLINNFRNLEMVEIKPSPGFNIIFGPNGSGKTSVLEAVYYLALARSFRGGSYSYLIQHGKDAFNLFAAVTAADQEHLLGMSRSRSGRLDIKLNLKPVRRLIEVVDHLCVQVMQPQSSELITGGSELRRAFIDWGVFYAKPQFRTLWSEYRRALRQRNLLLKLNAADSEIAVWDEIIAAHSQQIDLLRSEYLEELCKIMLPCVHEFLPEIKFNFELVSGWDRHKDLLLQLRSNLERDRALGYTLQGCHRADLKIRSDKLLAGAILSRGQLKLLVCAMRLSQGLLLRRQVKRNCIFLIDDLNSELDPRSQQILLQHLQVCRSQVFITNISRQIKLHDASGSINYIELSQSTLGLSRRLVKTGLD